jgi:SulP family sulfate permease
MTSSALDRPANAGAFRRTFSDLVAGAVCGFIAIVASIGNGSLLFSHGLPAYLPVAIGLALFSTAVLAAVAALVSSAPAVIARTQEVPVVALSGVLVSVAHAVPSTATEASRFATVMVALALGTGTVGLAALILGWLRLGSIIRFIPYPVIGGFLAGTGWLITIGGIGLMLGRPLTTGLFLEAPDRATAIRLAVGVAFVVVAALAQRRKSGALVLPGLILAALIAFNVARIASGASFEDLRAAGWLIQFPASGRLWPAIHPSDIALVDWHAILVGAVGIPTMIVVSIIALLMNATSIEIAKRRDLDLDRELRVVGLMNLLAGAGGAVPGFHSFSLSLLAERLGASTRLVGIVVAGLSAAALLFGGLLLQAVPTFILGGLLTWIGISQLVEWLALSYRRIGPLEYALVILIFVIIVGVNFAVGILAGLVAAIALFAVEYGRIDIVRHEMTGIDYQTAADESERRRELLQIHGDAILIIRLQGYLFFGTADRLRRRVQRRVLERGGRARFLVIDFRRVAGLDSSAVVSFIRLGQTAEREGFIVVLTGLSNGAANALSRGGFTEAAAGSVRFEPDIERGLKWCEDRLLADLLPELSGTHHRPVRDLLSDIVGDSPVADAIAARCDRLAVASGETLIERGAPSSDIFFVESGRAAVEIPAETGDGSIRLATVGPGAIIGEMAFYLGEKRSASIVAEEPMTVWRFSRAAMDRLQAETPGATQRFHEGMAAILAKRLNRIVRFLAD